MRVRIITPEMVKEALEMWESGYPTFDDIARTLRISRNSLRPKLLKAWRKKHPRGQAPGDFLGMELYGTDFTNHAYPVKTHKR